MAETLLSPSVIKLYGRIVAELHIRRYLEPSVGIDGAIAAAQACYDADDTVSGIAVRDAAAKYATSLKIPKQLNDMFAALEVVDAMTKLLDANNKAIALDVIAAGADVSLIFPANYDSDGSNKFLQNQLTHNPRLARIYSFSYEGSYYELPKPAIFLVQGVGRAVRSDKNNLTPTDIGISGVAAKSWEFSSNPHYDFRYWIYDKGDFSIRMDIESGQFWQILLEDAMRRGTALTSGDMVRATSGDMLRVGADMRRR